MSTSAVTTTIERRWRDLLQYDRVGIYECETRNEYGGTEFFAGKFVNEEAANASFVADLPDYTIVKVWKV